MAGTTAASAAGATAYSRPAEPVPPVGSHIAAPLPPDEAERLRTLQSFQLLDTARDDAVFDAITHRAARELGVDIALISLVDRDRQWFKSAVGLDASETGRDVSFCSWAILPDADNEAQPFQVPDARLDTRFAGSPLVQGAPGIRSYLGMPLVASNMQRVGTLCAISKQPRVFGEPEQRLLRELADATIREMEMRRADSLAGAVECLPHNLRTRKALQVVSHHLRTPLHGVMGALELLESTGSLSAEQLALLHEARRAAQDMGDVITGITEAARRLRKDPGDDDRGKYAHDDDDDAHGDGGGGKVGEAGEAGAGAGLAAGPGAGSGAGAATATATAGTPLTADARGAARSSTGTRTAVDTTAAAAAADAPPADVRGLRVLNVDDLRTNRRLLGRMLGKAGVPAAQQHECEDGKQAVEAVATLPRFDVAFVDLQMPVMGGTEAVAAIVAAGVKVPLLVALTADATAGARERCMAAGFDLYLTKPCKLATIREALEMGAARKSAVDAGTAVATGGGAGFGTGSEGGDGAHGGVSPRHFESMAASSALSPSARVVAAEVAAAATGRSRPAMPA